MGKKPKDQDRDREMILASIHAEQGYIDAQEAVERASAESGRIFQRLVKGRDLEELRELNRMFKDLKGSFKRSEAFDTVWRCFLKDLMDDYTSGRMDEEAKAEKGGAA